MKYKPFIVAWWHTQALGAFRLACPHWHSGLRVDKRAEDGAVGMVACVMASSERQAKLSVGYSYDRYHEELEFRPCVTS